MATRGTYNFTNNALSGRDICIYVHHDNYPTGAAEKFQEMEKNGKVSAESFIKGNPRAEITAGHEMHGDTEYRYDIDCATSTIQCFHRKSNYNEDSNEYETEWVRFYDHKIIDFIADCISIPNHMEMPVARLRA